MPCQACCFQTIVNRRKRSRQFAKALSGRSQTWTALHHLVGSRAHKIEGRLVRDQWSKVRIGRQAKHSAQRRQLAQERAKVVSDVLVANGVQGSRIALEWLPDASSAIQRQGAGMQLVARLKVTEAKAGSGW